MFITSRYPGFHERHSPYEPSKDYYQVLSARISFVLAFVIFVMFVTKLVSYIVPDTPMHLQLTIKREKFLRYVTSLRNMRRMFEAREEIHYFHIEEYITPLNFRPLKFSNA